VVFNLDCGVVIDNSLLHEKADWTPYEGIHLQGWPSITISRGEVIVKDGQFLGRAGRGQFLKRSA
ncbi:MAG TPA: dihydropyrimidinase, partial [Anaerolineae bacterium]